MTSTDDGSIYQERKRFETTTDELRAMSAWLASHGVTHVAMESTGVYWKPIYNLLHQDFDTWVVNARHLSQVPGRKTDEGDAEWICKLMRYGLLEQSFIPDEWQRDLRDLTRYRTRLIQEKSSAVNRLQKILEDANIKLSSVVSDIKGVSARLMLEALIADNMDAIQMADLAKRRLRAKIPQLVKALTGYVRDHHRFMLQEILNHLDELNARITTLDQQIRAQTQPYQSLIERLDAITGVGQHTAEIVLAEVGPTAEPWATSGQLASWACLSPGNNISAGKRKSSRRRKGQKWLVTALVEAAWAASRTKNTYFAAQFHRIRARRGPNRAAVAVAHSILTVIYHLLSDPEAVFTDLGGDYFLNKNKEQQERRAVKILESLGHDVTLTPATL
jgi:transposase